MCVMRRAVNLPQLDQNEMVAIRTAWFEEVGGAPTGNKCACFLHRLEAHVLPACFPEDSAPAAVLQHADVSVKNESVADPYCDCCAVAMERKAWSEPVAAGAISERGRLEVKLQMILGGA